MSRLYDALLRADQKPPKTRGGAEPGGLQSEPSVLAGVDTLLSGSAYVSKSAQSPSDALGRRLAERNKGTLFANGFRHLSVPIREDSRLSFHSDPHGLVAQQFRLLGQALNQQFATGGVLMITSPGMGDGKTLTALNLCACLAESGDPTLLVEADIRRPTLRGVLGCALTPPGLEDAWAGKVESREAVHFIEELSLHAAMIAKVPNDPSRLINEIGVKAFLMWAREHFRWVVLDAAPVFPCADVAKLLPIADAVLLVVRAQNTPRDLARRAFELLGKRLHGVILNEAVVDFRPYDSYLNP